MNRTWIVVLAGAIGLTSFAETAPLKAAEAQAAAPRTLEASRARVRAEAVTSLALGDVETVRSRRKLRRRYVVPRRFSPRYIHRRGRWCGSGRYYGRRCYYTPRILKPFRR